MKILHICMGNPFTEEMGYKENYIVKANLQDGHDVMMITPTLKWSGGTIIETSEENKIIYGGVRLIRLKYDFVICKLLSEKIRKNFRLRNIVDEFKPDVIIYDCLQSHALNYIPHFKKNNPQLKIYADVSTTYENSAKNFISKMVLHKGIYKYWIQKTKKYFNTIFYVSPETKEFVHDVYGLEYSKLEYSPLCGKITSRATKENERAKLCSDYGFSSNDIIFVHSGKMDSQKRTVELLDSFSKTKNKRWRLIIAGSFSTDIEEECKELISKDERIFFIGFIDIDELTRIIEACDIYLQPGSPSQTANTAICCFAPVILTNIPAYKVLMNGNGWLIDDTKELDDIFEEIDCNPLCLKKMSFAAEKIAKEKLDYRVIASQLYN